MKRQRNSDFSGQHPSWLGEPTQSTENNRKENQMVATFQVHKQTYGRWPAKNGKPGGESFDLEPHRHEPPGGTRVPGHIALPPVAGGKRQVLGQDRTQKHPGGSA